MSNTAPKFKKIILILKEDGWEESSLPTTIKIEHEDCAMVITGNYVIITEDHTPNIIDNPSSVVGKIYKLNNLDSYKLYNN